MRDASVKIGPGPTPDTVKVELENPAPMTCPQCGAVVPPPVLTTKITDGCYSMLLPGDPRNRMTLHLRSAIDLALAMAGTTSVRINTAGQATPRVTVEHNNVVQADLGELVTIDVQPIEPGTQPPTPPSVTWV